MGAFHVPLIGGELFELLGKTGGTLFSQTTGMAVKIGVTAAFTVTAKTCGAIQVYTVESGVNV